CCDTSMCEAATVGLGRRNPPQSGPRSISPQRRAATPSEVALNERNALTSTPGRQKCRPLAMRASQKRLAREIGEGRRAEFHSHMNHAVGSWAHVLEGFHWLTTFVVSRAIDSLANLSVPFNCPGLWKAIASTAIRTRLGCSRKREALRIEADSD